MPEEITPPELKTPPNKINKRLIYLLVILVALGLFLLFYVFGFFHFLGVIPNDTITKTISETATSSAKKVATTSSTLKINDINKINVNDVTLYKNDKWGYSFEIPKGWFVTGEEDKSVVTDGITAFHGIGIGANGYPIELYITDEPFETAVEYKRKILKESESGYQYEEVNNLVKGAEKSLNFTFKSTGISYTTIATKDGKTFTVNGGPNHIGSENPNLNILFKRLTDTLTLY